MYCGCGNPHGVLSLLIVPENLARLPHHDKTCARDRFAHGSWFDRQAWIVEDRHQGFGLTVAVQQGAPDNAFPLPHNVRVDGSPAETQSRKWDKS